MRVSLLRLMGLLLASITVWGCSNANENAVTLDASGKHPTGWVTAHGATYLRDNSSCTPCHGASLTGGIVGVSCSSSSLNGQSCHAFGPHPVPWPGHSTVPNQLNSCSPCHGAGLAGGNLAPACSHCHTQLVPGTVPVAGTCTSCHGTPPNGRIFPNYSAVHNGHLALPLPESCLACHQGGGSGTATHGTTLTVAFPAAYSAKTGTAFRDATGKCANISCHGGKLTPLWRGGRIDTLKECLLCHEAGTAVGQPQANSYYSGNHSRHLVDIGLRCTDCHDMTVISGAAAHFSGLQTQTFELAPAKTMRIPLNYNSGAASCSPGSSPPAGSFSIGVCHALKTW